MLTLHKMPPSDNTRSNVVRLVRIKNEERKRLLDGLKAGSVGTCLDSTDAHGPSVQARSDVEFSES